MSKCSCVFDPDLDCVDTEKITSKHQTNKTRYRECSECGKPTKSFLYEFVRFDGHKERFNTCPTCENIRNVLCCSWFYGNVLDNVRDSINENNCGVSEDCIIKLTPEARDVIFEMIETCWKS